MANHQFASGAGDLVEGLSWHIPPVSVHQEEVQNDTYGRWDSGFGCPGSLFIASP
jgi:hypothetical protein